MQYKIPQNVGIEDKIVGPLTLRQLIIIAVGCGISYVFFAILSKLYELNILEYIIVVMPALFSVAFAMIKINDIPLTKYIFLFLEFAIKPKKRVWDHRGISSVVAPDLTDIKKEEESISNSNDIIAAKAKKAANLRELTRALNSGSFEHLGEIKHEDIDVTHDDDLVTQAYFGHKRNDSKTENMYWRTKDAHMKMLDMFAKMPITKLIKGTKETEIIKHEIAKVKEEVSQMRQVTNISKKPVITMPKPPSRHIQKSISTVANSDAIAINKKRRRRKRSLPQPVRANNLVSTIVKNQPAKYVPNNQPKQPDQPQNDKPKTNKNTGEFDFRELKKGEIEINLD